METKRSFPWPVLMVLALMLALSFQTACAQTKKEAKKTAGDTDIWVEDIIPIPAPKEEIMVEAPGDDYVWIPGYWERDPDQWDWIAGHWDKPPHRKAHWVNGSWQWEEGKWHWNPGHWMVSYLGEGLFVDEPLASPPLIEETRPPKPTNLNHWVPGYWEWDGTWFWMPGYWTARTDVDAKWVAPGWADAGEFGYKWTAGHWALK